MPCSSTTVRATLSAPASKIDLVEGEAADLSPPHPGDQERGGERLVHAVGPRRRIRTAGRESTREISATVSTFGFWCRSTLGRRCRTQG